MDAINAKREQLHAIVDLSFFYHLVYFRLQSRRISPIYRKVNGVQDNLSYHYYLSHIVEDIIRSVKDRAHNIGVASLSDVTVSIAFDKKSARKLEDANYKAKRRHTLSEFDHWNQRRLADYFRDLGYGSYVKEGLEADDLIHTLSKESRGKFKHTFIYTGDKDMLINVDDRTSVVYDNQWGGKTLVTPMNFEAFCLKKFKCLMPYNSILLYLSTVGDGSDGITGVENFWGVSFSQFIERLSLDEVDFKRLSDKEAVREVLERYFSGDALKQGLNSLDLAAYRDSELSLEVKPTTASERERGYAWYGIKYR